MLKDKIFQKRVILEALSSQIDTDCDWASKLQFSEHHLSHAASAFYPSPFESAAILTMDGVGEWVTTSLAIGSDNNIKIIKEINFPHSIGLLYSAITYYAGFKVNSGEYKVMGLAPYGNPIYADLIKDYLIDIKEDGSFWLDMSYFNYVGGLTMTSSKFNVLFGGEPRQPESSITQKEMDLAASIQSVIEEVVIKLCEAIVKETGQNNLCLAGGVALNCVLNGKLLREGIFENIWIQPAAGDAGGAIGAALAVYYLKLHNQRIVKLGDDSMSGSYLGTSWSDEQIESCLREAGAVFDSYPEHEMIDRAAKILADGGAMGWHQDRMEFGPRSLGGRSILADPRSPKMQKQLNLKVKFRESFRPFAPSILAEDVSDWFSFEGVSPYMLMVANIKEDKKLATAKGEEGLFGINRLNVPRSEVPAITHIDYSARIQTVHLSTNPKFHALISRFKDLTGCPILVNTSFNVRGELIVHSPLDAYRCFMGTDLDFLIIGNYILSKKTQPLINFMDYKNSLKMTREKKFYIIFILASLIIVFVALELIFRSDSFSTGSGAGKASQRWFAKNWAPINQMGYRDVEFSNGESKSVNIFLGDSFTAGHGVKFEETNYFF